jgi:hypothetical protein
LGDGGGSVQVRRRTCRQSGEQAVQADQPAQPPSWRGQAAAAVQDFFSMGGPSQPGPPLRGAGESQDRVRSVMPRPHATLQSVQLDHSPQLPGTEKNKNYF